jgi:hypothetical protein
MGVESWESSVDLSLTLSMREGRFVLFCGSDIEGRFVRLEVEARRTFPTANC